MMRPGGSCFSPPACRSRSSCRNNRATMFQISVFCRTVFAKRHRERVQRPRNTRCPVSSSSPPGSDAVCPSAAALVPRCCSPTAPWVLTREVPLAVASYRATGCQTGDGDAQENCCYFFLVAFWHHLAGATVVIRRELGHPVWRVLMGWAHLTAERRRPPS
jgi:hypothetical protein